MKKTTLHQAYLELGATMVDFAGWQMPIHYGSQMQEHNSVRENVGIFDVSHMCAVDVRGKEAKVFLRTLIANDVAKLTKAGTVLYGCMLNENGGVIDDLIVYYISHNNYRLVVNAGTTHKDLAWINQQAQYFNISVTAHHDFSILAVQGPNALSCLLKTMPEVETEISALKTFEAVMLDDMLIARTGYTGEDGFEIILPEAEAPTMWQKLLEKGAKPCGLAARDTLRLEAGLNLYGSDMDEQVSPYAAALAWTIDLSDKERNFIGRTALENTQSNEKLVGLVLMGKGVLRAGQTVYTDNGEGIITSGTFSPTLHKAIALARIPNDAVGDVEVDVRGKRLSACMVKLPFVRRGKILVTY